MKLDSLEVTERDDASSNAFSDEFSVLNISLDS